ncbi:MAG: cyclic peptide export ABC transporter [Betaproteobacteria bacterium]|jgi:putative ATP-binding cassette transporter
MVSNNLNVPLVAFLKQGNSQEVKKSIFLSSFVGLLTTLIIANVNEAASSVSMHKSTMLSFFLFIVLILLFVFSIKKATVSNVRNSQVLIHKFKVRVIREVFNANLSTLDEVGKVEILQVLGRDAQTISSSLQALVVFINSVASIVFISLYVAFISVPSFVVITLCCAFVLYFGLKHLGKTDSEHFAAWQSEARTYKLFSDFLYGFKEIKMNSSRAKDIGYEVVSESREASEFRATAMINTLGFFNYMTTFAYGVLGIIVYVVPTVSDTFSTTITSVITAAIFLLTSIVAIINTVPTLLTANASARTLIELENALKNKVGQEANSENSQEFATFESLTLTNIAYRYKSNLGKGSFQFGPVNCEFKAGNVYFISGANGSGKTTLMRLISGLYQPSAGEIYLNSELVVQPASEGYMKNFATVFSDFFLFQKLYGLFNASDSEINEWISILKLQNKFSIEEGKFSDLQFSTGQRKRIALLVALLENRPILLLDEWAADQDPEFRKLFYLELIPLFKSMGKTIIAITHDDKYYDSADYLLAVDKGRLVNA